LLNGGGDVVVMAPPSAPPWRIGVRDPRAPDRLLGVVVLARGVVASSGDYERAFVRGGKRYHHILDPRTGVPAESLRGVTVVGHDIAAANGLSVAIMVLGKSAGIALLADTPGVEAIIVDRGSGVWQSDGLRLQPAER
jgi:thiamine biosynthesis lipoprotein